jgi:hypothetical protein
MFYVRLCKYFLNDVTGADTLSRDSLFGHVMTYLTHHFAGFLETPVFTHFR